MFVSLLTELYLKYVMCAEVKNVYTYTSTPTICLCGVVLNKQWMCHHSVVLISAQGQLYLCLLLTENGTS